MAAGPLVAIVDAVDRELPDLRAAAELARLVQVTGVEGLEAHLSELEVVFAWNFDRPRLLDVVPRAPRLRWIQSISAGVEEPNVLVSPHRAGDHERWADDAVALFVDNLRRFVASEPLRNVVNVELGYAPGGRS